MSFIDKLNGNIFSLIIAYLTDDTIDALELWYEQPITQAKQNQIFWYERCQIFLKVKITWRSINWKSFYQVLNKARVIMETSKTVSLITSVILSSHGESTTEMVNILLDIGKDQQDTEDKNILITSIKTGNFETTKLLLTDRRFDSSRVNNYAIIVACSYTPWNIQLVDIIKLLINHTNTNPSHDDNQAIINAAENGYTQIIKILLRCQRVKPDDQNNVAIKKAANNGHLETVIDLLGNSMVKSKIVSENKLFKYSKFSVETIAMEWLVTLDKINHGLIDAVYHGNIELVRLLLNDPRVKPDYANNSTVIAAIEGGHEYILDLLLKDKRINPADQNNLAIITAARNGNTKIVELLLKDIRINPGDNNNLSLIEAVRNNHKNVVNLLLKDNRVNPSDANNLSIKIAANKGYIDIVKLLLSDSRVNVFGSCNDYNQALNNLEFVTYIKKKVKNSLTGIAAAITYVKPEIQYNNVIPNNIYQIPNEIYLVSNNIYKFYLKLITVVVRYEMSIINLINKLIMLISGENNNVIKIVYYAVKYILEDNRGILKNMNIWSIEEVSLYNILRGLFLLVFMPDYNLSKLSEIINYFINDSINIPGIHVDNIIIMSMALIGAQVGLKELVNRGLIITENMKKNIDYILKCDIRLLYD